jgi:hypothetical protein
VNPSSLPSDLAAAFAAALPPFAHASHRLAQGVSRLDTKDENFVSDTAIHLGKYTNEVAALSLRTFSPLTTSLPKTSRWAADGTRLLDAPVDAVVVWEHLVLAMESVSELGEAVTTALQIDPKIYAPHRRAHQENLELFQASAAASAPPTGEPLASAVLWCARRGIDVGKRYGLFVTMAGAL